MASRDKKRERGSKPQAPTPRPDRPPPTDTTVTTAADRPPPTETTTETKDNKPGEVFFDEYYIHIKYISFNIGIERSASTGKKPV